MKKSGMKWLLILLTLCISLGGCAGKTDGNKKKDSSAVVEQKAPVKKEKKTKNSSDKKETAETKSQSEPAEKMDAKKIEAPTIAPGDFPILDGSTATIPLGQMMYRMCTGGSEDEAEQAVSFTKTTNSYMRLMDQEADLLIAYEAGPKAKEDSRYKDLEIKEIGLDALVFLCNEENPVTSLTTEEIQKIYQGKISNWKEVGGEDREIVAFQRPENSGSQTLMENLMMKEKKMAQAPAEKKPSEMGELIDAVASYENSANALGYSVYYYASNMYQIPGIRLMGVDGVEPKAETIRSGEYAYVNPFYAVVRKDTDHNSPAYQLFEWLTSEDGQSLVDELGYVSVEKGSRVLPDQYRSDLVEMTCTEGRLVLDGEFYDGTAGVVIFDEHMKPEKRYSGIRLADGENYVLAEGSVILASPPMEGELGKESDEEWASCMDAEKGLFNIDSGKWTVTPQYSFGYIMRDEKEPVKYYLGPNPYTGYKYEKNGDYKEIPGATEALEYDQNGNFVKKITWKEESEVDDLFPYSYSGLETKYEDDCVTYYMGGNSFAVARYDGEGMDVFLDGKLYGNFESLSIRPHDGMSAHPYNLPYNFALLSPYGYSYDESSGEYIYTPRESQLIDNHGKIYATFTLAEEEYAVMLGKEFMLVSHSNSGVKTIQNYDGGIIYQWTYDEYGETEWNYD